MKKRRVVRRPVSHRTQKVARSIHPGVVLGAILAVIVLISLANWLYKSGAFAATTGVTQAQLYTDATALIVQSNSDIQAVAADYQKALESQASEYQAQIDELNGRIEKAIADDSVASLTDDVTSAPTIPGGDDDLQSAPTLPGGDDELPLSTTKPAGFWSRIGKFFANIFS